MKYTKFLLAFAILFSLVFNASAQLGGKGAKTNTFKKQPFDAAITDLVKPNVMAYQYVLIKDGKVVTEGADGQARAGTDGNMKMTTSTPQNIGSLAKFLSGTALVGLFEKPAAKTGAVYKERGLKGSLNMPIWGEFPKVWLDIIPGPYVKGPQQRNITFRQLLQHRSGFDQDWKEDKNLSTFPLMLEKGFNAEIYDKRKYANMNFTFAGYLLPLIERHNLNYDLDVATNGMTPDAADKYVRDNLGSRMDAMMRERIWNKMTPKFNITCDATKDLKNTGAYGYPNKEAKGGGAFDSMIAKNGHCVGSGGYFTSARDFANYVAHFSQTDLIVSKAGRDEMYSEGMPADDRIVWTGANYDEWIKTNFGMSRVAWSNGISDGNRTVLLHLPENYYLILFTTSPELGVGDLYKIGLLAFKEGMKHNF